ncbi:DUF1217 domain-containing protein [Thalassobaculum sp.]|uniref:DUF1217 domain-containing protein n=1 Tax=Thalassobaculum sp. TaxID=2022740 RepID=UPI0032EF8961
MLNAELALGILGGGSSLLGGSTGAPTVSALVAFKNYQKDQVAARKAFANREDIQRDIKQFKKAVGKLDKVEDLLKDRKTLEFVLSAFGLESELNNPGKLKAVLNSDPNDINSFANRLADSRFGELAKFLDTPQFGLKNLRLSDKQSTVIDNYLTTTFEKSLAAQNPAARDALFFLRRIGEVENTFEILGDLPLRTIVTDALNLPREIARQSVGKQASLIDAKLNLDAFRTTTSSTQSASRLDVLTTDLAAIGSADAAIQKSQTVIDTIVSKLEGLRTLYADYDSVIDPAGVHAAEIPIQQAALPDLIKQRGLVAAANGAVVDTREALTQLEALYNQARSAEDADALAGIQTDFIEIADKILGDSGYISGAVYADPNTGEVQNLLRNGTGGALPAGVDATADELSVTLDTEGTRVVTKSTDLAGFLTDLQAFRDGVANASFATLTADLDTAKTSLDTAKTTFDGAEFQTQINVASINNALSATTFAVELDTDQLALGFESATDALERAATIEGVLDAIKSLGEDAQEVGADLTAINTEYADRVAQLTDLIQNAGSITDGTSTVNFDNLLTGSTTTYSVRAGTVVQAEGGDLANSILAALPGTITAGNGAQLATDVDDVYKVALDDAVDDLTRDRKVLDFVYSTADPRGKLDAQIRKLQADIDTLIEDAKSDKTNLLSPSGNDLRVTLGSVGSTINVDAQDGFKDAFLASLEAFNTSVLSGGTIDDRTSALNDLLFTAGTTQGRLKAETYALNVQKSVLTEQKTLLEGEGGSAGNFFKPVQYTAEALKFIERYLVQKDLESQGLSVGGGTYNAKAAIASQIGSILPQGGGGINFLA